MFDLFSDLFDMLDGMNMVSYSQQPAAQSRVCPVCGHSQNDFIKSGRFGCGECYKTFAPLAEQAIRQSQSATSHTGKVPSKSGAEIKAKRRLEDLKRQLKAAVANEEYEKAAKLHSEIKSIEGGGIK